jgi:hypothetical protein
VLAYLVVDELNGGPINLLCLVLGLLHLEDMLVEVLLQLLVRQVDTELLKVVHLELFETVDVQHTHHRCGIFHMPNRVVHLQNVPLGLSNLISVAITVGFLDYSSQ